MRRASLEVYPPPPTLRDFLQGLGGIAQLPFGADAALDAIAAADPALSGAARSLLELAMSFRATPVQAVAALPAIR